MCEIFLSRVMPLGSEKLKRATCHHKESVDEVCPKLPHAYL